jgi:hypothetical protein
MLNNIGTGFIYGHLYSIARTFTQASTCGGGGNKLTDLGEVFKMA